MGMVRVSCSSVAVIGVPAGWYRHQPPAAVQQTETVAGASSPEPSQPVAETQSTQPQASEENRAAEDTQAAARKRERERRQREDKATAASQLSSIGSITPTATAAAAQANKSGAKKVVVTVTYDESGRVTQASGGDANAMRIARQKRFPAGKAGSATITIPLN